MLAVGLQIIQRVKLDAGQPNSWNPRRAQAQEQVGPLEPFEGITAAETVDGRKAERVMAQQSMTPDMVGNELGPWQQFARIARRARKSPRHRDSTP